MLCASMRDLGRRVITVNRRNANKIPGSAGDGWTGTERGAVRQGMFFATFCIVRAGGGVFSIGKRT